MHLDERGDEGTVGCSAGEGKHVAHEILGGENTSVKAKDDRFAMVTDGGVDVDDADDAECAAFLREAAAE